MSENNYPISDRAISNRILKDWLKDGPYDLDSIFKMSDSDQQCAKEIMEIRKNVPFISNDNIYFIEFLHNLVASVESQQNKIGSLEDRITFLEGQIAGINNIISTYHPQ